MAALRQRARLCTCIGDIVLAISCFIVFPAPAQPKRPRCPVWSIPCNVGSYEHGEETVTA